MARYTKRPVTIEAVKVLAPDFGPDGFDGRVFTEYPLWLRDAVDAKQVYPVGDDRDYALWKIKTLEGEMTAEPGDMIIRGVKGELYPCKADIFEMTYEPEFVPSIRNE